MTSDMDALAEQLKGEKAKRRERQEAWEEEMAKEMEKQRGAEEGEGAARDAAEAQGGDHLRRAKYSGQR